MAISPIRIPRLQQGQPIVDKEGRPTTEFLRRLNDIFQGLADAFNQLVAIPEIQQAVIDAQAAAAAAQVAADQAASGGAINASEQSIVNSFPTGYAGALLSADAAGNVTIVSHQRQYGDPSLNPTVPVTGGVVASGGVAGDTVRIFYDDPTRAGGAVTYQFTIDPDPFPVQGGDRHSVGAVTIPGAGTQNGGGVRPPGYANPDP